MNLKNIDFGLLFVSFVLLIPAALIGLMFLQPQEVVFTGPADYLPFLFLLFPLISVGLLCGKKWAYFGAWLGWLLFFGLLFGMLYVQIKNSSLGFSDWVYVMKSNYNWVRNMLVLGIMISIPVILWRKRRQF